MAQQTAQTTNKATAKKPRYSQQRNHGRSPKVVQNNQPKKPALLLDGQPQASLNTPALESANLTREQAFKQADFTAKLSADADFTGRLGSAKAETSEGKQTQQQPQAEQTTGQASTTQGQSPPLTQAEAPAEKRQQLPTYSNEIRDRKTYDRHTAAINKLATPYQSSMMPADQVEQPAKDQTDSADVSSNALHTNLSPWSQAELAARVSNPPTGRQVKDKPKAEAKLQAEPKPDYADKLETSKAHQLEAQAQKKLDTDTGKRLVDKSNLMPTGQEVKGNPNLSPTGQEVKGNPNFTPTGQEVNDKSNLMSTGQEVTSKPTIASTKLNKVNTKLAKTQAKADELYEKRLAHQANIPTTPATTERIFDSDTGKSVKQKTTQALPVEQYKANHNNPSSIRRIKHAQGAGNKVKTTTKETAIAPVKVPYKVTRKGVSYGVRRAVDMGHRELRNTDEYQKNELLRAAHYLEQKAERELVKVASKLTATNLYRFHKNKPYRQETKLQHQELKNARNQAKLLVAQDKLTGTNHLTGGRSTATSRFLQNRQIDKHYEKAKLVAKKQHRGNLVREMAREGVRGNPRAIATVLARHTAKKVQGFVIRKTLLNPFFWKVTLVLLLLLLMFLGLQLLLMMFMGAAQGFGMVEDEDISFVSQTYSGWEVDLQLFLANEAYILSRLTADFPPPADITNQLGVNGVVIYPAYPYVPPPPFYEHNIAFAIGLIAHDPVQLMSYLTAMHGEAFIDGDMTQDSLEAVIRELFIAHFGVNPGDWHSLFDNILSDGDDLPSPFFGVTVEALVEDRQRIERRWVQEPDWVERWDDDGSSYWVEEWVWVERDFTVDYQFWTKNMVVTLAPANLVDILRERLRAGSERFWDEALGMYIYERELHFDILNYTASGRQVVGNPFYGYLTEADRLARTRTGFNWLPFVTSHYGYRINPTSVGRQLHHGMDIVAPMGTPLFATHDALVTVVQHSDTGYGNMIRLGSHWPNAIVSHADPHLGADGRRVEVLYGHLSVIYVTQGQAVREGELIGRVGTSGDSTGPHLHIEVIRPQQSIRIPQGGGTYQLATLPMLYLNPAFAMSSATTEQGNDQFRPAPGTGGITSPHLNFPDFPPEAMDDARFMAIWQEAIRHMGARYVWGATGPAVFDCSGFIHWVLTNAGIGWTAGRTNSQGYFNASTPLRPDDARPGDLVFFSGTHASGATVTHVGIYIGGGQMIHTGGNPQGVEIVNFTNNPFWQRHFYAFGRI